MRISTALPCLLCLLSACAPIPYTFHQLDYPGGVNERSGRCGGPPDQMSFLFNGIFISVRIDAQVNPNFGIDFYIPAMKTARLQSDKAILTSITPSESVEVAIRLVPYNMEYTKLIGATGLMTGRTRQTKNHSDVKHVHAWYPYKAEKEPVSPGDEGRLILPSLYIDDVLYQGPSIPYHRVTKISIDSFNC